MRETRAGVKNDERYKRMGAIDAKYAKESPNLNAAIMDLRTVFIRNDSDGTTEINVAELGRLFIKTGKDKPDDDKLKAMIAAVDRQDPPKGTITYDDFIYFMTRSMTEGAPENQDDLISLIQDAVKAEKEGPGGYMTGPGGRGGRGWRGGRGGRGGY